MLYSLRQSNMTMEKAPFIDDCWIKTVIYIYIGNFPLLFLITKGYHAIHEWYGEGESSIEFTMFNWGFPAQTTYLHDFHHLDLENIGISGEFKFPLEIWHSGGKFQAVSRIHHSNLTRMKTSWRT